jgi:hypothetical protein
MADPEVRADPVELTRPVLAEHQSSVDDAEVTVGRLVAVLENDMDALYRVAFAYQKADEEAERKFRQTHPHGPL